MSQDQTISVVKLGGTEGVDFAAISKDCAALIAKGRKFILVHGGSAEANALGEATGNPPRFITSPSGFNSRYTDLKTLEIFAMAVNGKVNTFLVSQLQNQGINAFGLSGLDGGLIKAERKTAIRAIEDGKKKLIRDDYSGKITSVNTGLLHILLDAGYLPVVAPLAIGMEGEPLNVDADRAAGEIAAAMQADHLILLTAVPGLLKNFPDESSLIPTLTFADLERAMNFAEGRMKKKVLGAQEAIQGGTKNVIIADGRIESAISSALNGGGTWIK